MMTLFFHIHRSLASFNGTKSYCVEGQSVVIAKEPSKCAGMETSVCSAPARSRHGIGSCGASTGQTKSKRFLILPSPRKRAQQEHLEYTDYEQTYLCSCVMSDIRGCTRCVKAARVFLFCSLGTVISTSLKITATASLTPPPRRPFHFGPFPFAPIASSFSFYS